VSNKCEVQSPGAVYTPDPIAKAIISRCEELLEKRNNLRILEPSVGDGAFVRALDSSNINISSVNVVDLDHLVIEQLQSSRNGFRFPLRIHNCDYLEYAKKSTDDPHPNLIVGNPPFIRYHNYSESFKQNTNLLAHSREGSFNYMKNAWMAFLISAENLLAPDGLLAFVLPYEIMTVDYGQSVLQSMQEAFHRIDIFVADQKAFPEIEQDAVIFFGDRTGQSESGLFIHRTSSFTTLQSMGGRRVLLLDGPRRGLEMNAFLLDKTELDELRGIRQGCASISDYASSTPGLVTAANDFFIRSMDDVRKLGLEDYARPVLRRSSFTIPNPIYDKADHKRDACRAPSQFLCFQGKFNKLSKRARDYILEGRRQDLHLRYKCRNRENWYEVPLANPKPGFLFKRSHSHPRIIINRAQVMTTDGAYGITPHDDYSIDALCFSFFNSLTMLFAEIDGRFYGGGVLELTPREFRGLPLVYKKPSEKEFNDFLKIHRLAKGKPEPILDFGDAWLGEMLNIDGKTLQMIRKCWEKVRVHRMRHGNIIRATGSLKQSV